VGVCGGSTRSKKTGLGARRLRQIRSRDPDTRAGWSQSRAPRRPAATAIGGAESTSLIFMSFTCARKVSRKSYLDREADSAGIDQTEMYAEQHIHGARQPREPLGGLRCSLVWRVCHMLLTVSCPLRLTVCSFAPLIRSHSTNATSPVVERQAPVGTQPLCPVASVSLHL
jgi:hypothetical protein